MRRFFIAVALLWPLYAPAAIPTSQRDALVAFYQSTGGASWTNNQGWLGAAGSECSWFGVQCNDGQTAVSELQLFGNNLRGPIPSSIRDLTALTDLILFDNGLTGNIPPEIGQLSNLERLYLDRTGISGPIPPAIGSLSNLRTLAISGTAISGSIPRELGNLVALEELGLSDDTLSGAIPPELGQLANLRSLDLSRNPLSGSIPGELGNLAKLESLALEQNSLSGTIPPELGRMTSLQDLRLSYNRLSGAMPAQLGALRNLQHLDLGYNQLSGAAPPAIGDLATLDFLDLSNNLLDGPFPSDLLRLSRLKELHLAANRFSGAIPVTIANLASLRVLSLYQNQFSGPIPTRIGSLPQLASLELQQNQLSGSIPAEVGNLSELKWIDLSGNTLTGQLPASLTRLTKLTVLSLYDNQIEGTIPADIGALTKLQLLFLNGNRLTGTIPDSIRNLHELTQLTAGANRLSGPIPGGIAELAQLERLYLAENQLSGPIPPQITTLQNLTILGLDGNRLTGSIPSDVGKLRKLEELTLGYNELVGPLPLSIGQLTNLENLSLQFNELSGPLPREMGTLANLVLLDLTGNNFEGTLPAEIGNLARLLWMYLPGNRFSGAIPREIGRLTALRQLDLSYNAFGGEIPVEITQLVALDDGFLGFQYNMLAASNAALRDFLSRKKSLDWEQTQTITPRNPKLTQITDRGATLEWDLIPYNYDGGGYQVVATAGSSSAVATTGSKDENSIVVRGLNAATAYQFTVSTVTHPHDFQQNLLVSDASAAISGTTGARVNAPAEIVVTEPTAGLVQVDGTPRNSDSFTLTNFGDAASALTLSRGDGDFFTIRPDAFTLAGGASQVVILDSIARPIGTYYGSVGASGDGTGDGLDIPVVLLSVSRPAGTVIAQAVSTRIEVAGVPGSDSIGVAKFRNVGTATLSGMAIADQPWVQPSSETITIDPGQIGAVNFRVVRSKRPDSVGALTANLSLVYVDGSAGSSRIGALDSGSGISISTVTVVDVSKPPTSSGNPTVPGTGEVAILAAGLASFQRSGMSFASDVSILNASQSRSLSDLRLYFTPAGAAQSTVATLPSVAFSQAVSLVNVLTNVYNVSDGSGSLQIRSAGWQSLAAFARLVTVTPRGTFSGSVPLFRSDRGVPAGEAAYLAGVRKPADLCVQEVTGAAAAMRIDFLDAGGKAAGTSLTGSLAPFALLELRDSVPANAVTAIVTNVAGSAGRIAAYARMIDGTSGDSWSIVDWSRVHRFSRKQAIRIPFAEGGGGAGGRRRAVPHAAAAPRFATDVVLFNPGTDEVRAKLQVIDASGRTAERDITVAARTTITLADVAGSASIAHVVIEPARGELVATARTLRRDRGTFGTDVPVVSASAGLRLGQSQTFSDLDDSTSATVSAATPATFRTRYGLVETAGESVTVRARMTVSEATSTSAAVLTRQFDLGPHQQMVLDELVRSLAGAARDTAYSNLHNLQLTLEVTAGKGAVVPFVVVIDNGSGDTLMRTE